ncbi:MATE family efflux transporter [Methylibium sp.]|uniref:MATE family efflux transporter n=1 Tax=Methylibium sp. TaxID=2067992 RepID=UPI003D0BF421
MSAVRPTGRIARHAASILVGQVAAIGYTVADTVMTGRHDSTDLAALSIGSAVYICIYIALTGVLQALIPVVGHHHGAGDSNGVRLGFQQSVWLALLIALPGMAVLLFPGFALAWARTDVAVLERVQAYLGWIAWSLPAGLLFRVYSGLNQGLSRPLLVTALQLMALALKLPLNAWLIFGGAGVPALGVAGCALATLIVQCALAGVAALMLMRHPAYRTLRLFSDWSRPRWTLQRELLRLGLPSGAALFFEVTGFALMAVFIARLGTTPLAGHQIAANVASVLYMLPLSIGIATGALASQALGAGDRLQARRICKHGLALALALAALLGGAMALMRGPLVRAYSSDAAVQAMAAQLLLFVASFALRAYRIALLPALSYATGLWGIGLAGGAFLAFDPPPAWPAALSGPAAFWLANLAALSLVGALLLALLQRVSAVAPRTAASLASP